MPRQKKTSDIYKIKAILLPVTVLLGLSFVSLVIYHYQISRITISPSSYLAGKVTTEVVLPAPFPIGVDSRKKLIFERAGVEDYLNINIASNHQRREGVNWLDRLAIRLIQSPIFQQLASPSSRALVIFSGERKEEVIDNIGDILRWDSEERLVFESLVVSSTPALVEGKFFPGNYTVDKYATPEIVAQLINQKLNDEVLVRYTEEVKAAVPFEQAMAIASLLEREAYDFEDMRYISGIIWNRLFIDMNLQLDATLQYIKGEQASQPWWPKVVPDDKYLESPYNTYENSGLPPSPIANPSLDAILAALNPRDTDCFFYFHEDDGTFNCSNTYEEHVAALKRIYGQGR